MVASLLAQIVSPMLCVQVVISLALRPKRSFRK
jgi:hypothetical protein